MRQIYNISMLGSLFRKMTNKLPSQSLGTLFSMYAPFIGAGIKIKYIAKDFSRVEVEMPLTWYNGNYVGTHFGGSLYAMTDPFYMFMIMNRLGREYIVWDKGANIRFRKPGKGRVKAIFELTDTEFEEIKRKVDEQGKFDFIKSVEVLNNDGEVVAEVEKTIYLKRKDLA